MIKNYIIGINKFIRAYYVSIIIVLILLTPFGYIFIQKTGTNNNLNENGKKQISFASESTPVPTQGITLPTIYRDSESDLSLSLQLEQGSSDTGQFDFFIPQKGFYRGVIPLLRSGQQIVHLQGSVIAKFYSLNSATPVSANVRMEGEVNTVQNRASLNVWIDNIHYQIKTSNPDIALAKAIVKQVSDAMTAQNWPVLYNLLSSDVRATTTQDQFIGIMKSSSSPKIISVDINIPGQVKINEGYTYFFQPVTLTAQQPNGSMIILYNTQYYVLEQGIWRLLTTDTPK